MRLLHTSDWHLGHALHGVGREREHAAFLAWLLDALVAEQIDVLLITGDVFDGSVPPASAEAMWFKFLADARARAPRLRTIVIGGNHDSPARLAAPAPMMAALGVTVVASMPRDPDDAVIELDGAIVVAIPFLRPFDLPALPADGDPQAAVRAVYTRALATARARRAGRPIVVTGHLFVAGAEPSWLSERRIVSGGQEAVDRSIFADDLAYVALGHLHRAQRVGPPHVRYAGSPIPLAMVEADYRHQVMRVELDGDAPARLQALEIPRTIELLRIPRHGAAPLDEALAAIARLPADDRPVEDRPLLEVAIALPEPQPRLRDRIEAAVADRAVRLVKIHAVLTGDRAALADVATGRGLADLDPREVLARRWARDHDAPVPADVARAFDELLEHARSAP